MLDSVPYSQLNVAKWDWIFLPSGHHNPEMSLWQEEVVVRLSHRARWLWPAGNWSSSLSAIDPSVCLRSLLGAVGVLMITALRDASPPVLTLRFNQNLSVAPDLTAVDNHHVCHRHSQVRCASIFQLVFFFYLLWLRTGAPFGSIVAVTFTW